MNKKTYIEDDEETQILFRSKFFNQQKFELDRSLQLYQTSIDNNYSNNDQTYNMTDIEDLFDQKLSLMPSQPIN